MSKNPLEYLNKRRRKSKEPSSPKKQDHVDPGVTPVEDLALPTEDHIESVYEFFQTKVRGSHRDMPTDGGRNGDAIHRGNNKDAGYSLPKTWNKHKLPDYRPGPVKIYTKAEIEEYENDRRTDI